MNEQDFAVKLENHEQRLINAEHRLKDLEMESKSIMDLTLSVNKLATNMESMLSEQQDQGKRLKTLEDEPSKAWLNTKRTVVTSIVSTISGALATGLIYLLIIGMGM